MRQLPSPWDAPRHVISSFSFRSASVCLLGTLLLSSVPTVATAQTVNEEEQATLHFQKGRDLYSQGKYAASIGELEKAFALRPAPPILLNIGRTYEKLKKPKKALEYYERFLLKARLVDPSRPRVEKMVRRLEKTLGIVHKDSNRLDTQNVKKTTRQGLRKKKDFTLQLVHTPVDIGKLKKPITLEAELPPDLDVDTVWIFFRRGGEKKFRKIKMREQGEGYMGIIPGKFATVSSMQYYLVAQKKGKGKKGVVATAGSKSTPHIIVIEGGRPPHIGPERHFDVRSPYRTWFWVAAAGSVALLGGSLTTFILAQDRANALETRAHQACNPTNIPGRTCPPSIPTRGFDRASARDFEKDGKMFATLSDILLGVGVAAAAGAGVLWYLDRDYVKREQKRLRDEASRLPGTRVVHFTGGPWVGPHGAGFVGRIDF